MTVHPWVLPVPTATGDRLLRCRRDGGHVAVLVPRDTPTRCWTCGRLPGIAAWGSDGDDRIMCGRCHNLACPGWEQR